jgi:hypothetical protein
MVRGEPPRAEVVETMLFLSAVQGNPVCMVLDIDKRRSRGLSSAPRTKWRMNSWLLSPGTATYLGTQRGKAKRGTLSPVFHVKDELVFTTDKDEFLYYLPTQAGKVLLLSDPLFADRVRTGAEEEIRYGRMPAKLICRNRTVEGNLFYERWAWVDAPERDRQSPFGGLEPGGRMFVLWGPGGEFLYLERGGEALQGSKATFAVMQDRRGRWQETYQIRWSEPECAFSTAPCEEASDAFRLSIPAWDVEGSLERLHQVQIPIQEAGEEDETVEEGSRPQETFWSSLREIPQAKGEGSARFCLLKGNIWVERNQRAVYGMGLLAKGP